MAKLNELIVTGPARVASTLSVNNTVTAPTFSGDLTGQATKALQDASGNVITSTYQTKSDANSQYTSLTSWATTEANRVKSELINNAGEAYDTLKELGDLIDSNTNALDALNTVAAGKANATHYHGTINDNGNFTQLLASTTTDSGWSMINSSYNGYLLKSIRTQASAPSWILGNYSAGIAFGGNDTHGVMSFAYSSPQIRFAGGNGTKPVWYVTLTGTSGTSYDLNNMPKAATATQLVNSKTFQVNLASTSTASFNGTDNCSPGVTGTLAVGNGGTGQITANAAANAFINALSTGASTPQDADYYVCQYAGGGTTTTTYHRRPVSALYTYMKEKIRQDSLTYTGNNTFTGQVILSKTTDASGTANNGPALIVGGAASSTHLELDANEIMAKTNDTSVADLYLNNDGGKVYIGSGGLQVTGTITGSLSGTASSATQLANARTFQVNLASTSAPSFNGTVNIEPGVKGTLAIGNGGTGITSNPSMLINLASTSAANVFQTSPRPGVTGTLPVINGGTGLTSFTAGGVVYGNSSSKLAVTAAGSSGQLLKSNGTGAPTWSTMYWANVAISASSSTATTPTFKTVTIDSKAQFQYNSTTESLDLVWV